MLSQIKISNNRTLIVNILLCLIPMSFIAGNLFINLNIIFLVLTTFVLYLDEIQNFKLNILDKIIIIFFVFIFFTLSFNYFESYLDKNSLPTGIIKKTFLYSRYFFLYISLRVLTFNNELKLNWFFIISSFCVIFVCIDIIFQFYFEKNIFGIVPATTRRLSGLFGDELIAGGYIQRFSIFAILLPIILNIKNYLNKYFLIVIISFISLIGIILSGNKMPFFLFLFSILLMSCITLNYKKIILILLCLILTIGLFNKKNINFQNNLSKFGSTTNNFINTFIYNYQDVNSAVAKSVAKSQAPYVAEFYGAYITWKKNIYLGGGLKSFRFNCANCGTHPHNYYLEFLTDLGLVGLFVASSLFFYVCFITLKTKNIFKLNLNLGIYILAFFIIFITEFFPIRSSGSFFSTSNSAFIFLCLGILGSLVEKAKTNVVK
jgi:O-antigen ligase